MIAFLVVTSIINLALGYALAVYLRRDANRRCAALPLRTSPPATADGPPVEDGVRIRPEGEPDPPATERDEAGEAETASEVAADAASTSVQETEQELLAGIEEFRNQLAHLRSAEPKSDSLDNAKVAAPAQ